MSNLATFNNGQGDNAAAERVVEKRLAAHRGTAEAIMQGTILPALATVRDGVHRQSVFQPGRPLRQRDRFRQKRGSRIDDVVVLDVVDCRRTGRRSGRRHQDARC